MSLKISSFRVTNSNFLSLPSLFCFPDLMFLWMESFWLIHTYHKAWHCTGKQKLSRGLAKAERSKRRSLSGSRSGEGNAVMEIIIPVLGTALDHHNNSVHTFSA